MAEWIPCTVGLSQATWHRYRERLEDIVVRHPSLFKGYRRGSHDFDDFGLRRGRTYADEWGCIWHFPLDGMQGQVIGHPLEEWRGLDSYEPPDPVAAGLPQEGAPLIDWDLVLRSMDEAKER
ncbi:TPA: hypothetical protein EYP44_05465, partial [Candidatus Bathyarchaeota archaeon]|nr:hypothetical protein [Candidatus Bathyarchaeota archaeon]